MRYFDNILSLNQNQVWVFGSNAQGFHGAGSAAWAMYRKSTNCWRVQRLDDKPNGFKGFYAVKGCARGFQVGTEGKSYAIQTVDRIGAKRSVSLEEIEKQIIELIKFAKEHSEWDFLISGSPLNKISLSGYSGKEIKDLYVKFELPDNIVFTVNWKE